MCLGYKYAAAAYTRSGTNVACTCGDALAGGSAVQCDQASTYLYTRSDVPLASAVVRRRNRRAPQQLTLCPAGYTSCAILPGGSEYECLNTEAELGALLKVAVHPRG